MNEYYNLNLKLFETIGKQTPQKTKPKIAVQPSSYDYKARFGLLKEIFIEQLDEIKVLTTSNEQMKTDLVSTRN